MTGKGHHLPSYDSTWNVSMKEFFKCYHPNEISQFYSLTQCIALSILSILFVPNYGRI